MIYMTMPFQTNVMVNYEFLTLLLSPFVISIIVVARLFIKQHIHVVLKKNQV